MKSQSYGKRSIIGQIDKYYRHCSKEIIFKGLIYVKMIRRWEKSCR